MNYFDQSASTWDDNPGRIAVMKAVGEAILKEARPTREMEVLDYGCGTGLITLFLLPHVRSVVAADSSTGMLDVLRQKIAAQKPGNVRAVQIDLEHGPLPPDRYHMVIGSMVLHHIAETEKVLGGFYQLLRPGGILCLADLDAEPGLFHDAQAAGSVHHHGFDRAALASQLARLGFQAIKHVTAHTIRKPVAGGEERDFPVFLMTARRPS